MKAWTFAVLVALVTSAPRTTLAQDMDTCIQASERALGLRKAVKLLDARAALSTCASSSCPEVVRNSCLERLTEVGQAIPSVVFFAKDPSGNDLSEVRVSIDGKPYADRLDGSAISLDPGEHDFHFEAAPAPPADVRLVLHQSEKNRRVDVVLGAPKGSGAPPPTAALTSHETSARPAIGLAVGGAGAALLVVGAVFGVLSLAAHDSYERDCGSSIGAPTNQCNAAGVRGQQDAATKGTLSTVFLIAGGAATAAGALIYLTAPRRVPDIKLGLGPTGFTFSQTF
jgi:hypothetical protein